MLRKCLASAVVVLVLGMCSQTWALDFFVRSINANVLSIFDKAVFTGAPVEQRDLFCDSSQTYTQELMVLNKGQQPVRLAIITYDIVKPGTRLSHAHLEHASICFDEQGFYYDYFSAQED